MSKLLVVVLAAAAVALGAKSDPYQYDNEYTNSSYLLKHNYPLNTFLAQHTILLWADEAAIGGPWSTCILSVFTASSGLMVVASGVLNKSVVPPSGNKHNYMSW
jgi:hypothetical protein